MTRPAAEGGETSQEARPILHFRYDSIAGTEITNFSTLKSSEDFLIKAPTLVPGVSETEKDRTNPFHATAPPPHPTFVVFFTDGKIYNNGKRNP